MIFFQLPAVLPLSKPDMETSSSRGAKKGCKLRELSGGYMGKLLVYKSGKVKMKFGENLFDVSVNYRANLNGIEHGTYKWKFFLLILH